MAVLALRATMAARTTPDTIAAALAWDTFTIFLEVGDRMPAGPDGLQGDGGVSERDVGGAGHTEDPVAQVEAADGRRSGLQFGGVAGGDPDIVGTAVVQPEGHVEAAVGTKATATSVPSTLVLRSMPL
jgi:hypothetical protein